jgi:hypothetical protein
MIGGQGSHMITGDGKKMITPRKNLNPWKPFRDLSAVDLRPSEQIAPLTQWAKETKYFLQFLIGLLILCILVWGLKVDIQHESFSFDFLKYIGEALALSAAVDLAYMLFTPGPDEALDPVIVALAATILILISTLKERFAGNGVFNQNLLWPTIALMSLVLAVALLFYVRKRYRQE